MNVISIGVACEKGQRLGLRFSAICKTSIQAHLGNVYRKPGDYKQAEEFLIKSLKGSSQKLTYTSVGCVLIWGMSITRWVNKKSQEIS